MLMKVPHKLISNLYKVVVRPPLFLGGVLVIQEFTCTEDAFGGDALWGD